MTQVLGLLSAAQALILRLGVYTASVALRWSTCSSIATPTHVHNDASTLQFCIIHTLTYLSLHSIIRPHTQLSLHSPRLQHATATMLALLTALVMSSAHGAHATKIHPGGNSSLCLEAAGYANGHDVFINDCIPVGSQEWTISPGSTIVQFAGYNYCLDAGSSECRPLLLSVLFSSPHPFYSH